MMPFDRMRQHLIAVLKESQFKLGYAENAIGIHYMASTLCHLLDCPYAQLNRQLAAFAREVQNDFGEVEIAYTPESYCLTVPAQGVRYVHGISREDEFLNVLIQTARKPGCTVDDIKAVFYRYSDDVHVERVDNEAFDWLIYFNDSSIDPFWYCLHEDGLQLEYHRFIKEDYLDFGF